VAGVLAVAALHASPRRRPEGFTAVGLATLGGLGLLHTGTALALGRFVPALTPIGLAVAAAAAFATRDRRSPRGDLEPRLADAISAAFLLSLAATTVFPYVHFDTRAIWACRATAFASAGSLAGVTACAQPNYPPLFSVLLWLGEGDPLFEGRLLVFLLLSLFALLLRARLARVHEQSAAPALLFLLATVNVWQGAAKCYADVPLMVFLAAGGLLALGLGAAKAPDVFALTCGAICLAAAVLVRPDGLYYAAVLLAAALAGKAVRRRSLVPFACAALAAGAWALRPETLKASDVFYARGGAGWRAAGSGAPAAAARVLLTFLDGTVSQWLAHNGLGVALYALGCVALLRRLSRAAPRPDARAFALVSAASLAAVALCYLIIPFVGEPVVASAPPSATYLDSYLRFIWTGMGRMTTHLFPFFALYAASALRDVAARG
jgi:hypothetical protein